MRYEAGGTRGAGRGGLGASSPSASRARRRSALAERRCGRGRRAAQADLGARDRQRRHAVPGRFGAWASWPSAGSTSGSSCIRSSRSSATPPAGSRASRGRSRGGGAARKLHPHPCRAHRRRDAPQRDDRGGSSRCSPMCASACRTGGAMLDARRRGRSPSSRPTRRRCRSRRSRRRSQFLEWLIANNFTFLGVREYVFTGDEDALEPRYETGLGLLRDRDVRVLRRGDRAGRDHAGDPRIPGGAEAADRHQGGGALARAPARLHGLHRRQALRRRRASSPASSASSACSPRPPIRARRARSRICAARSTPSSRAPASIPEGHSGKALVNVLETYPRDELFQIDEDTALPFALGDPAARRAAARARAAAARPLRPLRLGPRLSCRATATTATCAQRSATISPRSIRAASAPSIRSSRKGRWCACISSSAGDDGETPNPDRATLEDAVSDIVRTWTDGLAEALARGARAGTRARAVRRAIATRSRTAIARPIRRRSRSPTSG